MKTAPAFDARAYARRLKQAGVDEAQAEAHAEAVRDAITEGAAAKAGLDRLEGKVDAGFDRLKVEIDRLKDKADRDRLEADIDRLKDEFGAIFTRLETRIMLTIIGAHGMLFAALKLSGGA